jgi:antitoxin HigA-1
MAMLKLWIMKTTIEVCRMMKMYNPPHPGEVIKGLWLDPLGASITDAAQAMGVSRKTLSKIVNGHGRVTPEIAIRLSITLGGSPESWLGHQVAYDLWQIEQHGTGVRAVPLLQPA